MQLIACGRQVPSKLSVTSSKCAVSISAAVYSSLHEHRCGRGLCDPEQILQLCPIMPGHKYGNSCILLGILRLDDQSTGAEDVSYVNAAMLSRRQLVNDVAQGKRDFGRCVVSESRQ